MEGECAVYSMDQRTQTVKGTEVCTRRGHVDRCCHGFHKMVEEERTLRNQINGTI